MIEPSRQMNSNQDRVPYPIKDSPLFDVTTKGRLATVLRTDPATLRRLAKMGAAAYRPFNVKGRGGKLRMVQDPIPELKVLQAHINKLLQRVEYPEYIQAGVKGLSYQKNAMKHLREGATDVCTVDIEKFYPSCQRGAVVTGFQRYFRQSYDVASQLADLVCVDGHLPTGGPASLLVSFWSNRDVFDEIYNASLANSLLMTVYVDDMTFSGHRIEKQFIYGEVLPILARAGFRGHKIKLFREGVPAEVTGLMLLPSGVALPFRRQKDIHKDFAELKAAATPDLKLRVLNRLISRLNCAAEFHPNCRAAAKALQARRERLLSVNPWLRVRQRHGKSRASIAKALHLEKYLSYVSGREKSTRAALPVAGP